MWKLARAPLALSLLMFAQTAARAAEEADHGGGGGGMPQLDPSTFVSQIVWLVVAFGVLFYLLNRKLLPAIIEARSARQQAIDEDLERATKLRAEAEEALRTYENVVAEAHDKAHGVIKAAQDKLQAEFAERQAKLESDIAARLDEAENRIKAARDSALGEISGVAVETAQAAARKLIGIEISAEEAARAVEDVKREVA